MPLRSVICEPCYFHSSVARKVSLYLFPLTARPPLNSPALRSKPSERPQGLPRGSSQTELLPGAPPSWALLRLAGAAPQAPRSARAGPEHSRLRQPHAHPPLTPRPPPAPEEEEAPPSALPLLKHRAGGAWPMAAGSRRG